mmetsp:Transcript_63049/g.140429  ORF Transcript_63049/g.140429 Transcript_63049/m.140429 type:complete len:375 (-) Transcript_63049:181-1305(-)
MRAGQSRLQTPPPDRWSVRPRIRCGMRHTRWPPLRRQRENETCSARRARRRHAGRRSVLWIRLIHDDLSHGAEGFGFERLGEEVRPVVGRANERDVDLELLHHITNEEVAALDVLCLVVMLRVVGQRPSSHVVGGEVGRAGDVAVVDAAEKLAHVHDILGGLRERHDLSFARRQSYAVLLTRSPQHGAALPEHDPTRRGAAHLPRGVGVRGEDRLASSVCEPNVAVVVEVGEHVVGLEHQLRRGTRHGAAQHGHHECEVRASRRGEVKQRAHALLVGLDELGMRRFGRGGGIECGDEIQHQLVRVGHAERGALDAARDAVRHVLGQQLVDVRALVELDGSVVEALHLDGQEVDHRSLVHNVPVAAQLLREAVVE